MRIGVDACCWSNRRGFGRFTRELLEAMVANDDQNEYLFFVDQETAVNDGLPERPQKIVASTEQSPMEAASASGRRSLKDLWTISRQVMKHRLNLFFFPAVYSYFPVFNRTKIVVTLHDVIADHHPELIFPSKKLQLFWKMKQNLAIRQADMILTVSEHSKQEIMKYFGIAESRLRVITEAARPIFTVLSPTDEMFEVLQTYQLERGERFLLTVGGISPHKNLKTLVDALHQLTAERNFSDVKLVFAGDYKNDSFHSNYQSLKQHIEQIGLANRVVFTGFIEDSHLAYLYNAATLLAFPSLEEGFGLPAIEAMACGTPVVASNRGSLPEVVGDAGCFFDPYNLQAMVGALRHVLSDDALRAQMREAGLLRAQQFMWDKAARDALTIFHELVEQ